jgi:hypothetical protein
MGLGVQITLNPKQNKKMENLVRVSTYAKKSNLSTTYIYDLINEGKLECVVIDGVKFIKDKNYD